MLNIGYKCIFWFITLTFAALSITARPRNSRQAGTPTASCESRKLLTNLEGTVMSPNFPGPYPANSSCTWIITPPQTVNLSLRFTSFNIFSNSRQCGGKKCRCDFVQIKELDPPQNVEGFNKKFCNDNQPNMVYNLMSRVRIRFVSDATKEGTGFSLNYETLQAPTTAPTAFDFAGVHAKAALKSGTGGGTGLPVNQTVVTTTSARSNITDAPTQSAESPNLTSSLSVPLSAFTSKVPGNFTTTTDAVVQVTSETPTAQELNGSGVTLSPKVNSGKTMFPRTFPVTGVESRGNVWTRTAHVVMAIEKKKVEEKVPDIIILGPSVPVVMIFVLVVAGIAWWNYKYNSEELSRYETYAKRSKAKRRYNKNMQNISKGNLYNKMTKDWRGQSFSVASRVSPMAGRKISFAGKLRELADGVRTPRSSRPPSEEMMPLNKPGSLLTPNMSTTAGGSRPSSRPASLLLRDALANMFGSGDSGDTQESCPPSKRASKRVSFIDEEAGQPLVQQDARPPDQVQEKQDAKSVEDGKGPVEDATAKPSGRLHIPAIIVRQPSEDVDDLPESPVRRRKYPAHEFDVPEVISTEESPDLEELLPASEKSDGPGTWDDSDDNYPDSTPEELPDRSLIFPDLEDFLLNLDKDSSLDEPPYSCGSHVRDILRKSYGDEGLGDLGPNAVLSVPEEFLGMIRGSPASHDRAMTDSDEVDDVD